MIHKLQWSEGSCQTSWWFEKIWKILVKLDHFPKDRGKHKTWLKPPPSKKGHGFLKHQVLVPYKPPKKNNESIASDGSVTSVTIDMNGGHWLHMTWFLAALLCLFLEHLSMVLLTTTVQNCHFFCDSCGIPLSRWRFLNMVRRKNRLPPKHELRILFFTPANCGIVAAIRWNILSCWCVEFGLCGF